MQLFKMGKKWRKHLKVINLKNKIRISVDFNTDESPYYSAERRYSIFAVLELLNVLDNETHNKTTIRKT